MTSIPLDASRLYAANPRPLLHSGRMRTGMNEPHLITRCLRSVTRARVFESPAASRASVTAS